MDKIRKKIKFISLKWCFVVYMPLCLAVAFAGSAGIGLFANYLQDQYENSHELVIQDQTAIVYKDIDGVIQKEIIPPSYGYQTEIENFLYQCINVGQVILVPVWVFLCVFAAGVIFYKRELKKPLAILTEASDKIARNDLDFVISFKYQNELGRLCESFEQMRRALYQSNLETWHSLEERKRLNSAFSHDLRTPLTVLKGYAELMQNYIPQGKVSEEKQMDIVKRMSGNIMRLERYVQSMNSVQKLEDVCPEPQTHSLEEILKELKNNGELLCMQRQPDLVLSFQLVKSGCGIKEASPERQVLQIDTDLLFQVYENLLSNAIRYAHSCIWVECMADEKAFYIQVTDDGSGFSREALASASQPFFHEETDHESLHFGLGLYICRTLCEKHGGGLNLSNSPAGGARAAVHFCTESLLIP